MRSMVFFIFLKRHKIIYYIETLTELNQKQTRKWVKKKRPVNRLSHDLLNKSLLYCVIRIEDHSGKFLKIVFVFFFTIQFRRRFIWPVPRIIEIKDTQISMAKESCSKIKKNKTKI